MCEEDNRFIECSKLSKMNFNTQCLTPSPAAFLITFVNVEFAAMILHTTRFSACEPHLRSVKSNSRLMTLADLPREILTRCFSYLSTDLLTDIILLDNIPDNILEAAANNINHLWYANRLRGVEENAIIEDHYETSFDQYHDKISHDRYHFETEFDRFVNIHKVLEKKSITRPPWFHYRWENIFEMRRDLDRINSAFKGQSIGINADLRDMRSACGQFFSDHDMDLKITCLSLWASDHVNLNDFPNLKSFYGKKCEMMVDYTHPSLKNLYLEGVTFSSLPVDLERLVGSYCDISIEEDHPKLEGLRVLVLQEIFPHDCPFLLQVLWNKDLETFSYTENLFDENDEKWDEVITLNDVMSMIGPKVTKFGFTSSSFSGIPTLLRSLYSNGSRNDLPGNRITLYDWTAFTHMTSLTISSLRGSIDTLELPPNLLKLSITCALFNDINSINFPMGIVDLELSTCDIKLTDGWLKPARLKRLSLADNELSSFKAFLPCCEYLSLESNFSLTDLEIEAPILKHIDLGDTGFATIPNLPDSLQVLVIRTSHLRLTHMPELPSSLKVLDLAGSGALVIQDYTFPPSIQELNLGHKELLKMSGVKFAKGSRLKELILSRSCLTTMDDDDLTTYEDREEEYDLTTLDDKIIELPSGLKALKLQGMNLENIDDFTIPQSVTFLDLRNNNLRYFFVKSHIETLYLNENPLHLNFAIHEDLELRVLDLTGIGITMFSFEMVKAPKLAQLRLGAELKVINLLGMPAEFQILEHYDGGSCHVIEPETGPESYIYSSLL